MNEPKSLDSLFKEKIFRIPDYQRGYAWQLDQLKAFWEDVLNLPEGRFHYTGVLTLRQVPNSKVSKSTNEHWLLDDHSYQVYHIVDGQQRLTTFVIFIQSLIEFFKSLNPNTAKDDDEIYITDSLNIAELRGKYLYKIKPTGVKYRTYKFGYTEDNPSYEYLRYNIFCEEGTGRLQETFYTLNLANAKQYFSEQLADIYKQEGIDGIGNIYKKITKRFLFNEYVIKDEFDVFVAFETMNNRGKKLSDLELLKNRLIYLTTLYVDNELDEADRTELRESINDAWKQVYHQLGRNKSHPLNDDDFLRAHWITYFKYSRNTGRDYAKFLLEEQFTPQRIHHKIVHDVQLEIAEELSSDLDTDDLDESENTNNDILITKTNAALHPEEIRNFVLSLKESSVHWFNSFYPHLADGFSGTEQLWISRLNRIGLGYFRPLVMVILKTEPIESKRIQLFQKIERFIFLAFRIGTARSNYRSSEFYNFARTLNKKESTHEDISRQLDIAIAYMMDNQGMLEIKWFQSILEPKFKNGSGYYGWSGLKYFLFEYEQSLLSQARQKKFDWEDLLKTENDKISIEHIYPQTPPAEWEKFFERIPIEKRRLYNGSLGNLLLLSMSINSRLQNDSFEEKKSVKYDQIGTKIRNGYSDGSHSEIEVAQSSYWGPNEIKLRGMKLIKFMESRWNFLIKDDAEREKLLFLDSTISS